METKPECQGKENYNILIEVQSQNHNSWVQDLNPVTILWLTYFDH